MGWDLANLSSQGDKDRTSVKEDIGHSYKKRLFFFQRDKNQILFQHIPSEMSMKPMKAFKVNVELYKIAENQYFLLIAQYFHLWMPKPIIWASFELWSENALNTNQFNILLYGRSIHLKGLFVIIYS